MELKDLNNYRTWKELISEDEFHSLFNELISKHHEFDNDSLIDIIDALSERYLSFWGTVDIAEKEKIFLNNVLKEQTDFSDLTMTEDLIGIMFNFRLEDYYSFLRQNSYMIASEEIKNEVTDALKEYNESRGKL